MKVQELKDKERLVEFIEEISEEPELSYDLKIVADEVKNNAEG